MANCPKCGAHLGIKDWRQHCPHCGANIVVYDLQEKLMQDADIAEVQNYHFQKKIDRLKASFIGSKLAIVRIITTLLPIGGLMLPIVNAAVKEPLIPMDKCGISFLTIYKNINGITGALGDLLSGSLLPLGLSIVLLVLSILMIIVKFVLLILACSPKAKQRSIVLNTLMLGTAVAAAIIFSVAPQVAVIGTLGLGGFLYIGLLVLSVVIDALTLKQGIEIHHKQCYVGGIPIEEYFEMQEKGMTREEIREEQYKRLSALQAEKEAKLKADEEAKAAKEAEKAHKE